MRIWKTMLALAVIWGGLVGCSDRKRSNPLDPKNPKTLGKLTYLYVLSEKHDVTLDWFPFSMSGVLGYNIYRRSEEQGDYINIAFVSSDISSYVDTDLTYDRDVVYRVSVVASGYESPLSDSVSITPGPYNYWVVDSYLGEVIKLTYDGDHIITRSSYAPYPIAVAADSTSKTAWVIDLLGYLFKFSSQGDVLLSIEGLYDPTHLAMDPFNGVIWVSDENGASVVRYDTSGNELGRTEGFVNISDMSCVGLLAGCWIADERGRDIIRLAPDGSESLRIDNKFDAPSAISFYQQGDWLWVADSLKLFRVWLNGNVEETVTIGHPIYAMSADQSTGDCWIITILEDGTTNEILKIGVTGDILVRVEDFRLASDLVANDFNGGCMVVDTGNYRIVRLSGNGEIMSSLNVSGIASSIDIE